MFPFLSLSSKGSSIYSLFSWVRMLLNIILSEILRTMMKVWFPSIIWILFSTLSNMCIRVSCYMSSNWNNWENLKWMLVHERFLAIFAFIFSSLWLKMSDLLINWHKARSSSLFSIRNSLSNFTSGTMSRYWARRKQLYL